MAAQTGYPATLRGELDEEFSRWLFLVKWILTIPHVVVLFFLSIAFVISWVASLFSILLTGRYPRGLFDLNMGINRWAHRVAAYAALTTDEYPPFRLGE